MRALQFFWIFVHAFFLHITFFFKADNKLAALSLGFSVKGFHASEDITALAAHAIFPVSLHFRPRLDRDLPVFIFVEWQINCDSFCLLHLYITFFGFRSAVYTLEDRTWLQANSQYTTATMRTVHICHNIPRFVHLIRSKKIKFRVVSYDVNFQSTFITFPLFNGWPRKP